MNAPPKSEGPLGGGPIAEQTKTDSADIVACPEAGCNEVKALANLKAALAITGHAVYELVGGGFLVVRPDWNGVRLCRNVDELRAFANVVGVQPS